MLPAALQRDLVDHAEVVLEAGEENPHVTHDLVHPVRLLADQGAQANVLDHVIAPRLHEGEEVLEGQELVQVPMRAAVDDDVKGQVGVLMGPGQDAGGIRGVAKVRGDMQSACTSMPWI